MRPTGKWILGKKGRQTDMQMDRSDREMDSKRGGGGVAGRQVEK